MSKKVDKICEGCLSTYFGFAKLKNQKYCSRKCYVGNARREIPEGDNVICKLREWIEYDPLSGAAKWRKSPTGSTPAGSTVGYKKKKGYIAFSFFGKTVLLHRAVWTMHYGEWPIGQLDHKNRTTDDNRIENLRPATESQQCQNRRSPGNVSGIIGVHWVKRTNKWWSLITVDRKRMSLGYFDKKEEAAEARKRAEVKYFGDYRLNP